MIADNDVWCLMKKKSIYRKCAPLSECASPNGFRPIGAVEASNSVENYRQPVIHSLQYSDCWTKVKGRYPRWSPLNSNVSTKGSRCFCIHVLRRLDDLPSFLSITEFRSRQQTGRPSYQISGLHRADSRILSLGLPQHVNPFSTRTWLPYSHLGVVPFALQLIPRSINIHLNPSFSSF